MKEAENWKGTFDIFIKSQDGDWEHEQTIHNMITDSGLNLLRDSLYSSTNDAQIRYIALGTSSTSVTSSDTQLGSELIRKPIYSRTQGTTGSVQNVAIFFDTEAVAQIEEIGVFAGSTASTTANSGIMISRILYSRNKSNLESLQVQRTDTIGRG